jgi:hypothetical protein
MTSMNRRDLIKMLSLTGAAGILTAAQGALSPVISASHSPGLITKIGGVKLITSANQKGYQLPVESNATITELEPGKAEVRFPTDGAGYMKPGRNQFKDEADLVSYLSQAFPVLQDEKGGFRGTIKRVSKYRRIDERNTTVFTFGDPILDLITDENGFVYVGDKLFDLKSIEMEDEERRRGGILESGSILDKGDPEFAKCSATTSAAQSSCGSQYWVPSSTASQRMRFRAWKNMYTFYWSQGSDIETWNRHFVTAEIHSSYGYPVTYNFCGILKNDSDHDSNDDYVDEYEWGISAPLMIGHRSNCIALWNGTYHFRKVCRGCFAS